MAAVVEHVVAGLATGSVYALLALALVLARRGAGVVNFAQGELATLSAFVCSALLAHGWAFWPAFGGTIVLSYGGGVVLHELLLRPLGRDASAALLLTIGLLIAVDGLDTWVWGSRARRLESPLPDRSVRLAGASLPQRELGIVGVAAVVALVVWLLLRRTKLGLGLRAAAAHPTEARFAGVSAAALARASWGLAAALGAVAGVLAAPSFGLGPTMMLPVLLYAFAAAAVGAFDSAGAAVAAAVALGVALELLDVYVGWFDRDVRPAAALAVLLVALLVRPGVRTA